MVRATNVVQYMRHTDNLSATPPTQKDSLKKARQSGNSPDMLYILDLSDLNKKDKQITDRHHKSAAMLDLSQDTQERLANRSVFSNERAESSEGGGEAERPNDETRRLTRMLVAAKSPNEVQSILVETYKHMREWQALAATGDEKAIKVVRKIQKLIARGNRKIRDLNKELVLLIKQQKAEKAEQEQLAQRLRYELKQAERLRKQRERRYLQERDNDDDDEPEESGPSMAALEAKIRVLAAAMAALSSNTANSGDAGLNGSAATGDFGIEGADVSGDEAAGEEQV